MSPTAMLMPRLTSPVSSRYPRHGGNYRSHHGKPYRAPDFVGRLIARYHIPMEEDIEVTIPIEITFTNGHAKITIRNWENQNVKPGGV